MSVYQEIGAAESFTEVHDTNVTLVDWFRDIATYDSLTKECEKIRRRQTELMEGIRTSKVLQRRADRKARRAQSKTGSSLTKSLKPLRAKTRMKHPILLPHGKMLGKLQTELHLLDAKLATSRSRMRRLAARMMTFDPKTPGEATALVRFVTRVLQSDDKVDRDYVADVLDTCADTIARVLKPSRQTVH